jgi:hypothetical protein
MGDEIEAPAPLHFIFGDSGTTTANWGSGWSINGVSVSFTATCTADGPGGATVPSEPFSIVWLTTP